METERKIHHLKILLEMQMQYLNEVENYDELIIIGTLRNMKELSDSEFEVVCKIITENLTKINKKQWVKTYNYSINDIKKEKNIHIIISKQNEDSPIVVDMFCFCVCDEDVEIEYYPSGYKVVGETYV